MVSVEDERKRFEAWKQLFVERNPAMPDLYFNEATQIAWMAWLARARLFSPNEVANDCA